MIFFKKKYLIFLFIIGTFISCKQDENIPSYIHIDKIDVSTTGHYNDYGSSSSKVTDAWVYVDDQVIGAFELPATFPALFSGNHTITIKPGIKVDGIAATRAIYPFYQPYVANINLISNSVDTIKPSLILTYYPLSDIKFDLMEDFEGAGIKIVKTPSSDTIMGKISGTYPTVFEGNSSGVVYLDATHDFFQGVSDDNDKLYLPAGDNPVFLEMNYKTNELILVGLYAYNTNSGDIQRLAIVYVNPTDTWNKIYINLKNAITSSTNSPDYFKVFFEISKSPGNTTSEIYFDNIKVLHNL